MGDHVSMMATTMMFRDRREAGQLLGAALARFAGRDPVVLALPRGGVAVGLEVARALRAPLDLILVRKIGAPFQPELAVGAVVDGAAPEVVTNADLVHALRVPPEYLERATREALVEIERRRAVFAPGRTRVDPRGKTAIVVDDGVATGATMRAALRAVRRGEPGRLVLAVPVGAPDTIAALGADADEVVCLAEPDDFAAIGAFYADFDQLSDGDVIDLLGQASKAVMERVRTAAEGSRT